VGRDARALEARPLAARGAAAGCAQPRCRPPLYPTQEREKEDHHPDYGDKDKRVDRLGQTREGRITTETKVLMRLSDRNSVCTANEQLYPGRGGARGSRPGVPVAKMEIHVAFNAADPGLLRTAQGFVAGWGRRPPTSGPCARIPLEITVYAVE
jgi:hypothetical protein